MILKWVEFKSLLENKEESFYKRRDINPIEHTYTEEWTNKKGQLHRLDGPSRIVHQYGDLVSELWYLNGKFHREDGPSNIYYYSNKQIRTEEWWYHGTPHRSDGPAVIKYSPFGEIKAERWVVNGLQHREGEPSAISYFDDGKIYEETWCINGEIHREDGAAVITYNQDGSIQNKKWYLKNRMYSKKNFWQNTPLNLERIRELLQSDNLDYEEKAMLSQNPNFKDEQDDWLFGGW
jgi:hypothetical protein